MIARLKSLARRLKDNLAALWFAARDPGAPLFARLFTLLVVAYALSPIDLIPDFVPVLGYLDDLLLVPLGVWLALRLMPPEVLASARRQAEALGKRPRSVFGAALVVGVWLLALGALAWWWFGRR